jgi:hypothetical protein
VVVVVVEEVVVMGEAVGVVDNEEAVDRVSVANTYDLVVAEAVEVGAKLVEGQAVGTVSMGSRIYSLLLDVAF